MWICNFDLKKRHCNNTRKALFFALVMEAASFCEVYEAKDKANSAARCVAVEIFKTQFLQRATPNK